MSAPFYFSIFYSNVLLNIGVIGLLGIIAVAFVMQNIIGYENQNTSKQHRESSEAPLQITDWLFTCYSTAILSVIFAFSSITIYLLKDYYHFENAEIKGGILIGITSIVAIIAIVFLSSIQKPPTLLGDKTQGESTLFKPVMNFFIPLFFLFSTILFYSRLILSFPYVVILSVITGISYGLFLARTRYYASNVAKIFRKLRLLSIYNNLPNVAALLGFSISYLLSLLSKKFSFDYLAAMLLLVMALLLIAFCFTLLFIQQAKRSDGNYAIIRPV